MSSQKDYRFWSSGVWSKYTASNMDPGKNVTISSGMAEDQFLHCLKFVCLLGLCCEVPKEKEYHTFGGKK